MSRLGKLKRQSIQRSNKRNLGIITEDQTSVDNVEDNVDSLEQEINTIDSLEQEINTIDSIPVEDEVDIDKHNHFHNIDFGEEPEDETAEWEIPVEMLFHGINTGDVSQIEAGTDQIDMPKEKEAAILKFANFIGADAYDLHRVADKLDLGQ